MELKNFKTISKHNNNGQYRISDNIKIESEKFMKLVPNAVMILDGLWFMNVSDSIGLKDTLKIDLTVISTHFKLITRFICDNLDVDGKTIEGKAQIFSYMAHIWGHQYEIYSDDQSITFNIIKCGFYEYLKKIGRDKELDCTYICKSFTPSWISEMDMLTEGKATTNFDIPNGGSCCRWHIKQS